MKILRAPDVIEMTGLSRVTLWRLERARKFPLRLRLSNNAVGWRDDEVIAWLNSLPRVSDKVNETTGRTDKQPG